MDNPRYERYLTSPQREQSPAKRRIRHLCGDLARKIGLRQLKPRTALVAGVLFVLLAGLGLTRSGLFRASESGVAAGGITPPTSAQPVETTVTVHVVVDQSPEVVAGGDVVPTSDPAPTATGGKIDLNTADVQALDTLPGIGPATAQKVIADRTANGPFTSPEDLMRVSGIGQKKFDALKDLITVGK